MGYISDEPPHATPAPGSVYREHPPPPALAHRVECIWMSEARLPPGRVLPRRVLPDGCMDILFDLGEAPLEQHPAHGFTSWVVGAMPRARVFGLRGRVSLVGVRFLPGGAADLLGFPAREATGTEVELAAVWGATARELEERLAEAGGPRERARLLGDILAARPGATTTPDDVTAAATAAIRESAGSLPVRMLATRADVTRRTLERRFADAVGLTPKQASRVARFRRAVRLLEKVPPLPLARVALAAGYHDQPHLTREFTGLAGISPGAWRGERRPSARGEAGSSETPPSSGVASVQDEARPRA